MLYAKEKPSLLVINPNSTASMTTSIRLMLEAKMNLFDSVHFEVINPQTGPPSINNDHDAQESLYPCIELFTEQPGLLDSNDAFLVACYSDHPLVQWLESHETLNGKKSVLGIFGASVLGSLDSMGPYALQGTRYGIVSTGKVWEELLTDGVRHMAEAHDNPQISERFAGVETTGLNATELHETAKEEVCERMEQAVKRLIRKDRIGAVCLGCAGMVGLEDVVRKALVEELGDDGGNSVAVVDGIVHGVWLLLRDMDRRGRIREGYRLIRDGEVSGKIRDVNHFGV